MAIDGNTELIAHLGFPTHAFKAPMIYNPYFASIGANAVVVPMGCRPESFPEVLRGVFRLENIRGALITMPHKVSVVGLLDEVTATARVAGACNAVKRLPGGRLVGDMFDGEGFVRGLGRKGFDVAGTSALIVGSGGVGSAIAGSLAASGVARLALYDVDAAAATALASRLLAEYPKLAVSTGSNDPAGFDLAVNATPLGMNAADPLPLDVRRLDPRTFVGEVVMKSEMTSFLAAARERGCRIQVGTDMLFEQIPAYLEFFGFPATTADNLRFAGAAAVLTRQRDARRPDVQYAADDSFGVNRIRNCIACIHIVRPPSTGNSTPVMNEASSLPKYAAAAAISVGSARRPRGMADTSFLRFSGVSGIPLNDSNRPVGVRTGQIALTRMFSGPSSAAIARESEFTAPFDAAYQLSPARGRIPATDPMLRMTPPL